jgi:hypothetical protein
MDMFSVLFPQTAAQLNRIEQKVDTLMASWEEAKQAWIDYATDLKTQRDDAVAALEAAQTRAQEAADALSAFQADDAQTDAQALADQAQAFADELTSALEAVQEPPVEPEPLPDPGNPSQAPEGEEPQVNPLA